jgi:chaperonin cofactor prefoldin
MDMWRDTPDEERDMIRQFQKIMEEYECKLSIGDLILKAEQDEWIELLQKHTDLYESVIINSYF